MPLDLPQNENLQDKTIEEFLDYEVIPELEVVLTEITMELKQYQSCDISAEV